MEFQHERTTTASGGRGWLASGTGRRSAAQAQAQAARIRRKGLGPPQDALAHLPGGLPGKVAHVHAPPHTDGGGRLALHGRSAALLAAGPTSGRARGVHAVLPGRGYQLVQRHTQLALNVHPAHAALRRLRTGWLGALWQSSNET